MSETKTPAGILKVLDIDEAIEQARREIDSERTDEQLGLYSSWGGINRGMGKYFRFNSITQIAGLSGHGKSYFINQLMDDFTDFQDIKNPDGSIYKHGVNREFKLHTVFIHFGFEMDASDEVLRMLTRKMVKSYHYLLSSEWDAENEAFNKVDDREFQILTNRLKYFEGRPIYFIENSGNITAIFRTVGYIIKKHAEKVGVPVEFIKPVVGLDHTFLVKKDPGMSDLLLIQSVAYMSLMIRKVYKAMVIILGQCNNNLKSLERISEPSVHYPLDSDIYMAAQVNWVCDNIWIIYQPDLVNIRNYGTDKIPTENLVVAACVKSRKGMIGDVYLKNILGQGRFGEFTNSDLPKL